MAKRPVVQSVPLPGTTTAAAVECFNPRFEDEFGQPNAELITMSTNLRFNGVTNELGDNVTFPRDATSNEKQTAVRARVNLLMSQLEPGVVLSNANIQISGLPV